MRHAPTAYADCRPTHCSLKEALNHESQYLSIVTRLSVSQHDVLIMLCVCVCVRVKLRVKYNLMLMNQQEIIQETVSNIYEIFIMYLLIQCTDVKYYR